MSAMANQMSSVGGGAAGSSAGAQLLATSGTFKSGTLAGGAFGFTHSQSLSAGAKWHSLAQELLALKRRSVAEINIIFRRL